MNEQKVEKAKQPLLHWVLEFVTSLVKAYPRVAMERESHQIKALYRYLHSLYLYSMHLFVQY